MISELPGSGTPELLTPQNNLASVPAPQFSKTQASLDNFLESNQILSYFPPSKPSLNIFELESQGSLDKSPSCSQLSLSSGVNSDNGKPRKSILKCSIHGRGSSENVVAEPFGQSPLHHQEEFDLGDNLNSNLLEIGGKSKASLFMSESGAGDLKSPTRSKCSLGNLDVGTCD